MADRQKVLELISLSIPEAAVLNAIQKRHLEVRGEDTKRAASYKIKVMRLDHKEKHGL